LCWKNKKNAFRRKPANCCIFETLESESFVLWSFDSGDRKQRFASTHLFKFCFLCSENWLTSSSFFSHWSTPAGTLQVIHCILLPFQTRQWCWIS
jgi:hypothetical protein